MAAVEHRHPQIAAAAPRDLTLEHQIGGQIIDRAGELAVVDRRHRLLGWRGDAAVGHAAGAKLDAQMLHRAVAVGLAVEGDGMRHIADLAPLGERAIGDVDEHRAEPGGLEIAPDDVGGRRFLDHRVRRQHTQTRGAEPLELHGDDVFRRGRERHRRRSKTPAQIASCG